MAIAQSTKKSQSGAGVTTNALTTAATGSVFVVICAAQDGTINSTITDSKSNSYGAPILDLVNGAGQGIKVWYKENGAGGASHTVSNSTAADGTLYLLELTGMLTSGALDQSASNLDSTNPFVTTGITTTTATQTIIAAASGIGAYTPSGGFTTVQEETDSGLYWPSCVAARDVTSTGTYSATFTDAGANPTALIIASFKAGAVTVAPMLVVRRNYFVDQSVIQV